MILNDVILELSNSDGEIVVRYWVENIDDMFISREKDGIDRLYLKPDFGQCVRVSVKPMLQVCLLMEGAYRW